MAMYVGTKKEPSARCAVALPNVELAYKAPGIVDWPEAFSSRGGRTVANRNPRPVRKDQRASAREGA